MPRCDIPTRPVVIVTDAKISVKYVVYSLLKAFKDVMKMNQIDHIRNNNPGGGIQLVRLAV